MRVDQVVLDIRFVDRPGFAKGVRSMVLQKLVVTKNGQEWQDVVIVRQEDLEKKK